MHRYNECMELTIGSGARTRQFRIPADTLKPNADRESCKERHLAGNMPLVRVERCSDSRIPRMRAFEARHGSLIALPERSHPIVPVFMTHESLRQLFIPRLPSPHELPPAGDHSTEIRLERCESLIEGDIPRRHDGNSLVPVKYKACCSAGFRRVIERGFSTSLNFPHNPAVSNIMVLTCAGFRSGPLHRKLLSNAKANSHFITASLCTTGRQLKSRAQAAIACM